MVVESRLDIDTDEFKWPAAIFSGDVLTVQRVRWPANGSRAVVTDRGRRVLAIGRASREGDCLRCGDASFCPEDVRVYQITDIRPNSTTRAKDAVIARLRERVAKVGE